MISVCVMITAGYMSYYKKQAEEWCLSQIKLLSKIYFIFLNIFSFYSNISLFMFLPPIPSYPGTGFGGFCTPYNMGWCIPYTGGGCIPCKRGWCISCIGKGCIPCTGGGWIPCAGAYIAVVHKDEKVLNKLDKHYVTSFTLEICNSRFKCWVLGGLMFTLCT